MSALVSVHCCGADLADQPSHVSLPTSLPQFSQLAVQGVPAAVSLYSFEVCLSVDEDFHLLQGFSPSLAKAKRERQGQRVIGRGKEVEEEQQRPAVTFVV